MEGGKGENMELIKAYREKEISADRERSILQVPMQEKAAWDGFPLWHTDKLMFPTLAHA